MSFTVALANDMKPKFEASCAPVKVYRQLVPNSEYQTSPWIKQIEKEIQYLQRPPAPLHASSTPDESRNISNVSCIFDLATNGKFENIKILPVADESSDLKIRAKAIKRLNHIGGIPPLEGSIPPGKSIKIIVHFYQYPEFGVEQTLTNQ